MNDTGNISGHSVNYVYDALKERLPAGWSLTRTEGPSMDGSGNPSAFYKWNKWLTGEFIQIEVHEGYAQGLSVNKLCDNLMDNVLQMFNDPQARYTTPMYKRMVTLHV